MARIPLGRGGIARGGGCAATGTGLSVGMGCAAWLCASCAAGAAGDCKSRFASGPWDNLNASACRKSFNRGACNITAETCTVQLEEDWSPVRGCSIGGCLQGCAYQLGCSSRTTGVGSGVAE